MANRDPKTPPRPRGRRPGARDADYEVKRRALARGVLRAMVVGAGKPSLHDMARATGVSIPTLKHYFGDRAGALAEALRLAVEQGAPYLAAVADPGELPLRASLLKVATDLAGAWGPAGVGDIFAFGMAAGMSDAVVGPGYLDGVLEPTIRAVEARLTVHASRGELAFPETDAFQIRAASLSFLSPVVVALLHQRDLSGSRCRPLDMTAFLARHLTAFVRAWGAVEGDPAG